MRFVDVDCLKTDAHDRLWDIYRPVTDHQVYRVAILINSSRSTCKDVANSQLTNSSLKSRINMSVTSFFPFTSY